MAKARAVDVAFNFPVQNDGGGYGVYMLDEGGVHVMPEFGPQHAPRADCWCHPTVEREGLDDDLVIHQVAH